MSQSTRLAGPAITRLRAATGVAHQSLEDALDAVASLADPARRRDMVRRYHALYGGAAQRIAPFLPHLPAIAGDHTRATLLAEDLRMLDLDPTLPEMPGFVLHDTDEALGFLYVIEGSALGGRMILKALAQRGSSLDGLRFLDPHGAETGARWREFMAALEMHLANDEARLDRATEGAVQGFAFARACLCEMA